MSIGFNREEMLETANDMQNDRQLLSQLEPLITKYTDKLERARYNMLQYSETDILYPQFLSKVKAYTEIIDDLKSLIPPWLRND